jgi:hypothetical protein
MLHSVRTLVPPFGVSIPLLICRALFVLLYVTAPRTAAGQNSPTNDKQLSTVQTQMRNVRYNFSDAVVVEIKSLNGEPVPVGNDEFPIFDDKNSFSQRISATEIAIDSYVLNSYVFVRPHSPLTELSIMVANGRLKVKGKLDDRNMHRFDFLAVQSKFSVSSGTENSLHLERDVPLVKGLMGLFGIDLGGLIKEGKVRVCRLKRMI